MQISGQDVSKLYDLADRTVVNLGKVYILDVGRDRVVQGKKVADAPWPVKLFSWDGLTLGGSFGDPW